MENRHVPKKLFLFFVKISPAIFFGLGKFSPILKPDSTRSLWPLPIFPFLGGVMGKQLGENSSRMPYFAPRDGHRRTKYSAHTKYIAFRFRCQKSPLRTKIQRWLFHMMYMNASPVGLSKKIRKISFSFWLLSFFLQKIGCSHFFAGGAWKRRRTTYADFEYEIWKVFDAPIHGKSLRCLRW